MVVTTRVRTLIAAIAVCAALAVFFGLSAGGGGRPAHADAAAVASDTVSVDGTGTVQGVPDRLTATFGVHVTRSNVHDALDDVATDAKRVLAALRHAGVATRDMRSTDLQLSPHYTNNGQHDGYDASETVTATFEDLSTAGRGISSTAASAGNAATVEGLSFDLSSDTKLLAQARSSAFADAKARAQQYADLAGRSLGAVRHVTETILTANNPKQFYDSAGSAGSALAAPAPIPVQPGQQPVTVVVTVVWQLT